MSCKSTSVKEKRSAWRRKKMKQIKTWGEVDAELQILALLDSTIDREANERDRLCREIKEKYNEQIKGYDAAKKEILELLQSFFIGHEGDPEVKGKTYEGPDGKCGLRLTPPSVKPIGKMTWERVLTRITDLGWAKKYLRPLYPTIKDINRELLASSEVDDGERRAIGVKLHQEERFWYETK
jgi:hypothetical protein